jgi:serine/threonine protein kinase
MLGRAYFLAQIRGHTSRCERLCLLYVLPQYLRSPSLIPAANILITHTGRVVLCDFGVSALLTTSQSKRTTFVGTPHWMAPEVITSGSLYDAKADIWSLGVTIYEMITGGPPHADQLNLRAIALIPKSKPPRLPDNAGSKEMKEFVSFCLRELPAEVCVSTCAIA